MTRPAISARNPLAFQGGLNRASHSPSDAHSTNSVVVAAGEGAGEGEVEDGWQRKHFYGYGDPDHVPSILQKITEQRYLGEF